MDEHAICERLMAQVLELAEKHDAVHVERVILHVGPLSGFKPHLLADAFPFVSAGTLAEGAELVIETQRVRVRCRGCGAETAEKSDHRVCGVCGGATSLLSGDELRLVRVDLVHPETAAIRH